MGVFWNFGAKPNNTNISNDDWIELINQNVTNTSNNWNSTIIDKSLSNLLINNFWVDNEWYEMVISVKKEDFSRKIYTKFQKLSGDNWIETNNIIMNSDLGNGNRSEFYIILGTANTGTSWRHIRLSGILKSVIDGLNVKIRKINK